MRSVQAVARRVVARHAGRDHREIRAWQVLEGDLELTRFQVALVVREVAGVAGTELSFHGQGELETVGDLFAFLSRSLADPPTLAQGFRRVA